MAKHATFVSLCWFATKSDLSIRFKSMAIDDRYCLISCNQLDRNGRNLIASEPACTDIDLVHDGRLFEAKYQLMLRGRRKSKRFAADVCSVGARFFTDFSLLLYVCARLAPFFATEHRSAAKTMRFGTEPRT